MYRGMGFGPKPMCPYCGGPHLVSQCPMMMYPPAMPMPAMPPMPMPPVPMPPMGGMMPGMEEHMMKVEHMLHQLLKCCQETHHMVQEMYMKMAKG